jgi:hypothetical protein
LGRVGLEVDAAGAGSGHHEEAASLKGGNEGLQAGGQGRRPLRREVGKDEGQLVGELIDPLFEGPSGRGGGEDPPPAVVGVGSPLHQTPLEERLEDPDGGGVADTEEPRQVANGGHVRAGPDGKAEGGGLRGGEAGPPGGIAEAFVHRSAQPEEEIEETPGGHRAVGGDGIRRSSVGWGIGLGRTGRVWHLTSIPWVGSLR